MKRNISHVVLGISLILFGYGSCSTAFAQNEQEVVTEKATVPDHVMKEVLGRVLRFYFKPRPNQKTIFISEKNIDSSWLPTIRNVHFHLLSDEEIEKRGKPIYFFNGPYRSGSGYDVPFSYGDPKCSNTGDMWLFHALSDRIRLRIRGSFGNYVSHCSNELSPSIVPIDAQ